MNREQFHEMSLSAKCLLAQSTGVTPEVQVMFIAEDYEGKGMVLNWLAQNTEITPQAQKMLIEWAIDD